MITISEKMSMCNYDVIRKLDSQQRHSLNLPSLR
jgi:hypothetical protein